MINLEFATDGRYKIDIPFLSFSANKYVRLLDKDLMGSFNRAAEDPIFCMDWTYATAIAL